MNFKETVQKMTIKEIILAMVNGLKNQHLTVDFNFFGFVNEDSICCGCAATNTICEISGIIPEKDNIRPTSNRWKDIIKDNEGTYSFIANFESAIDHLRLTNFEEYNDLAKKINIALIDDTITFLPSLDNYNYKEDTKLWENYANSLV